MNVIVFYQEGLSQELNAFADSVLAAGGVFEDNLVVVFPKNHVKGAEQFTAKLKNCFPNTSTIAYQCNTNQRTGNIAGSLLGSFYLSHFSMFPGAKLIVDGAAKVSGQTWLKDIENQHKLAGKWFTGQFMPHPNGGSVPVGPFVVEPPIKSLRIFSGVSLGIRERGRWLWHKSHHTVSSRQWPFVIERAKPAILTEPKVEAEILPDNVIESAKGLTLDVETTDKEKPSAKKTAKVTK